MATKLEITNWDQLVDAKSDYTNLRILVTHYNDDTLEGIKVSIADYNTTDIYFSGFVTLLQSTKIPETAIFTNQQIVDIVNSYGFNVELSEPEVVEPTVLTILQGLYAEGYRYIYKDYLCGANYTRYGIYATDILEKRMSDLYLPDMPEFVRDGWDWCLPNKTYAIQLILETGTVDNGNGLLI